MSLVRGGADGSRGGMFLLFPGEATFIGHHLQGGGVWAGASLERGF